MVGLRVSKFRLLHTVSAVHNKKRAQCWRAWPVTLNQVHSQCDAIQQASSAWGPQLMKSFYERVWNGYFVGGRVSCLYQQHETCGNVNQTSRNNLVRSCVSKT